MARTLVNAHQLAPFSGSSATQVKFGSDTYSGGLTMNSGSISSIEALSFDGGGKLQFSNSAIQLEGAVRTTGALTVEGNLVVNGANLTVESTTIAVEDSMIELAKDNNAADSLDIGFYGMSGDGSDPDEYHGLFRDASDGKFRLFKQLQAQPTSTVNIGGTGYASADLIVGSMEIGHDSDTTLSRASSGDVNVEGNLMYRAGGTDVPVADGGTGGSTAGAARTNLGLVIGTNVQAYDAELAAIAGLTSAADKGVMFSGDGTAAVYTLTATARSLLDDANTGAMRTTLGLVIGTDVKAEQRVGIQDNDLVEVDDGGVSDNDFAKFTANGLEGRSYSETRTDLGLVIGTNVQAYDAELAAIAGLTAAADKGIQFTGVGAASTYDLTAAGKALLDDANAGAQRTTLGLVIGTDVQAFDATLTTLAGFSGAQVTRGIADGNLMTVDDGAAGDNDFAKFTASGLEGRSYAEVMSDLSATATADFSMNSRKLTAVLDPTAAQDAATKAYVDAIANGLRWLKPVLLATTAELATNAAGVAYVDADNALKKSANGVLGQIDGFDLTFNTTEANASRILVKDQSGVKGKLIFSVDSVPANGENMTFEVNDLYYQINFTTSADSTSWAGGNGATSGARKTWNVKQNDGGENETTIAESIRDAFANEPNLVPSNASEVVTIEHQVPADTAIAWNVAGTAGSDNESAVVGVSSRNGIYYAYADGDGGSAWELRRAADSIATGDLPGAAVFVVKGSTQSDQGFVQTEDVISSLDDTHQLWSQFSGAGALDAGAGITKTGSTLSVTTGGVVVGMMAVNSVDSDQYVDASIDTAHIGNLQITNALMAANSVDSDQYVDASIDTAHIANDQITAALMADNSIDSDMYVDASIDLAHLSANSVDGTKIAAGSVDSGHLANLSVDLAHMSVNSIDSDQYVDASIDTAHIANAQITAALMAANSVDSDQYVDASIDTAHIGNLQITNALLAADAVTAAKLADNAVDSEHYVDASIDLDHLNAGSVNASKLTNNAVETDKILDNAVTLAKMAGLASANFIIGDGSGDPSSVAMSGDATLANNGALTIAANAIQTGMVHDDVATELAAGTGGLLATSGRLSINFAREVFVGSGASGYASVTGLFTLAATPIANSEQVYLNGQLLAAGPSLSLGDYTTTTGSVEIQPDLKLDADDVVQIRYLK